MYMRTRLLAVITLLIIALPCLSSAQLSLGGQPKSFEAVNKSLPVSIPVKTMGSVDVAALLAEDADEEKLGVPMRFGYPFDVRYDMTNSGIWETAPDGSSIWRLRLEAPEAYSINLIYDKFNLTEGVRFYVYNEDRSMVLGAFSSQNNKSHGQFATAPVKGDVCILEVNVPSGVSHPGELSVSRVVHAYRDMFKTIDKAFGQSGSCNNNVVCPEGDPWRDHIRSVAMIILGNGTRWCSGSMVNNVRQDLTPYFLTADHCLSNPQTFIIMFNYESPTCTPNVDGPTTMTVQGTTLLANTTFSDFALLLLDESPPDSFNVYYNGWSALDVAASTAVGIHHPSGDIKKISFQDNPVNSTSYFSDFTGGDNSHWRVDVWEDGTTEGGSSGSPLYDQNQRVIGQLHGGWAACNDLRADWYGKFSVSWDGASPSTRLKDWLDPDNTGTMVLDGLDQSGLTFDADTTVGWVPLDVNFNGSSVFSVDSWNWEFGDGGTDNIQNPLYTYNTPGAYDVRLEINSGGQIHFREKSNYIVALADTLKGADTTGAPGDVVAVILGLRNQIPLNGIKIPVHYSGSLNLKFDSINTIGCRTAYFDVAIVDHYDSFNKRATLNLFPSLDDSEPDLPIGEGDIVNLFFTINAGSGPGDTTVLTYDTYSTTQETYALECISTIVTYTPEIILSSVATYPSCCSGQRGNINGDVGDVLDISDLLYFVDYIFAEPPGPAPVCDDEADVNNDGQVDISDVLYLVDYFFLQPAGPAPLDCF